MRCSPSIKHYVVCLVASILIADSVQACAVCFGDPSSLHTKGLNAAILTLLSVAGLVVACIVGMALRILARTKNTVTEIIDTAKLPPRESAST